ncbi:MAG: peptide-methionine (S)-S-oxide reductase [Acidobacteria bacterium]|nr:MAG: peptide-methionine (S)-S-oxide reductase [Acidobacteriota bacterium]
MQSPYIGRAIATVVIVGLVAWTAVRALGTRSPETPRAPFPAPATDAPLAIAKSQQTSGGYLKSPSYEAVSTGVTGHAETISIIFDASQLTYGQLLMVFFSVAHDPTQWNRQGPDTGSQYRSLIFYNSPEQKRVAQAYIAQLDAAKVYSRPIVTKVEPFQAFYPADSYHQDFLKHNPDNPYIVYNDLPKLENLKRYFPGLYQP